MDVTNLDDFYNSESRTKFDEDEPKPKRRRIKRVWCLKNTYQFAKEVKKAVTFQEIWKICSSKQTSAGETVHVSRYYRASDDEPVNLDAQPTRGLSVEVKKFMPRASLHQKQFQDFSVRKVWPNLENTVDVMFAFFTLRNVRIVSYV
jgi:hypothetical protein